MSSRLHPCSLGGVLKISWSSILVWFAVGFAAVLEWSRGGPWSSPWTWSPRLVLERSCLNASRGSGGLQTAVLGLDC